MNHFGNWGLAAIMVVVISWLFYRYVAPRSWREWARAGLVQAFIIALYAEMYGFPLTLYLLARVFKLDVSLLRGDGNFWANLFGSDLAMWVAMLLGYSISLVGLYLVAAGWREVYLARRAGRLATGGPYAVVRHPQYAGILLAIFGEGVVHWPTLFSIALFPIIAWAYVRLARKEEADMLQRFEEEYRQYQRRVPRFLPRWGQLAKGARRLFGGRRFPV